MAEAAYEAVFDTETEGGRHEARNALTHVVSLSLTKMADGLIDPKLVLSWLLTTLGAPALFVGLLVPVREAGALLPQIFLAPQLSRLRRRKWAWVAGSFVQGVAALCTAVAGFALGGIAAGVAVVLALAVLAVARSLCSVSYKDILGRTVGKTRRGTVTGLASTVSSVAVIIFAGALMLQIVPREPLVLAALALAGCYWIAAAALFSTLKEEATEPAKSERQALNVFAKLKEDEVLRRFVIVRGLLTSTALAPPFLVLLAAGQGEEAFGALGALVLASALSSFLSSYVWGRLADRSSRKVLILSGLAGAVALAAALLLSAFGIFTSAVPVAATLFALMIAYRGVRQGRSTYLVDMAPEDRRSDYAAVANTVIGVLLLGSGAFGALASVAGPGWSVGGFGLMALAAAWVARGLPEVEKAAD
ncbi:MFS transporter [Rhodobacterales bacterium HKCCE3408]|nr:MFS transporter [Rhodobacterales bacterium HKCCE3408]